MTTASGKSEHPDHPDAENAPSPPSGSLTPGQRVRLTRENLALAMAFFTASHQGLVSASFVSGSDAANRDDPPQTDTYTPPAFSDYQSLVRSAGNQIRGAFALSALQTLRELTAAFTTPPLEERDPNLRAARVCVALIAQCVEADLIAPRWSIPDEYRQRFAAPDFNFTLDTTDLDGKEVRWEHFGGLPRYLDLILFLSRCLDGYAADIAAQNLPGDYGIAGELASHASHDAPDLAPVAGVRGFGSGSGRLPRNGSVAATLGEPAGWIAPDGPPAQRISVASQATHEGPITDFVADACAVGGDTMTLAGELYTRYATWCLDNGYLAASQRKFGLELTSRGYQRKRRGKGRHWWVGLQPQD